MKFLKWLLSMLVIGFIGLVLVGFMLPREISASRTAKLDASVDRVFAEIARPKAARDWLPVGALDDKTVYEFDGPESGNGAAMKWSNPEYRDYGRGRLTVTQAHPNDLIEYLLDLEKMGVAQMRFELAEDGISTRLTWTVSTRLGHSPFGRWFGLLLDDWFAEDIDAGLERLKAKLETAPADG